MADLTKTQLKALRAKLLERQRVLTEEVKEKREQAAAEGNEDAQGGVGDAGDESVTRMITDLDLQEAGRDLDELREIDAALTRMDDGSYGKCVDCGLEIDYLRLEAQPTAVRCVLDQTQHEKTYAHKSTPTL
jgi:RNA polymerase-binding protein DksA